MAPNSLNFLFICWYAVSLVTKETFPFVLVMISSRGMTNKVSVFSRLSFGAMSDGRT